MTDDQVQRLRQRFMSDIAVIEMSLLRYSPTPSDELNNAQHLVNGLMRGALASDDFTRALYNLAYEVPLEVN